MRAGLRLGLQARQQPVHSGGSSGHLHQRAQQCPLQQHAFANSATAALRASVSFSCSISAAIALLSTLLREIGGRGGATETRSCCLLPDATHKAQRAS